MKIANIKRELEAKGIRANYVELIKNGITCKGFQIITDSKISPLIYCSENETVNEFLSKVDAALKQVKEFDISILEDKAYVLRNLNVSVQRKSHSRYVVNRDFLNLEAIMRVRINCDNDNCIESVAVSENLLNLLGISINEAWNRAIENMASELKIQSMASILGIPEEFFPDKHYVVTTNRGVDGAAALLHPLTFRRFCFQHGIRSCLILPSSTQELIIICDNQQYSYMELAELVQDVNATAVDSVLQLHPTVYRYDLQSDDIRIVAEL